MDIKAFRDSLSQSAPPANLSLPLQALWQDGKGDWTAAHDLLQAESSGDGAWVHAYLHRKEGDLSNAGYWYRRANQPTASGALEAEWQEIVEKLL